ncbi:hypothetical protein AMAG_15306 [Allomyces macrogynus ATCC 38327]|uniref:Uncharacterized protein n=1 Tax=Allomyces macrogynus (strain ATCC 38327) TaxID=578462 RepID=A0A0L0T934_ALLM3|nr:hypothetical protein AMAG_15306 [Allomyces macrogynus ATCC 38327]|eukprot:KNE71049.1 hypothetical protein AMAG_15306 [Allomyces macrogynus ATCC 38327]
MPASWPQPRHLDAPSSVLHVMLLGVLVMNRSHFLPQLRTLTFSHHVDLEFDTVLTLLPLLPKLTRSDLSLLEMTESCFAGLASTAGASLTNLVLNGRGLRNEPDSAVSLAPIEFLALTRLTVEGTEFMPFLTTSVATPNLEHFAITSSLEDEGKIIRRLRFTNNIQWTNDRVPALGSVSTIEAPNETLHALARVASTFRRVRNVIAFGLAYDNLEEEVLHDVPIGDLLLCSLDAEVVHPRLLEVITRMPMFTSLVAQIVYTGDIADVLTLTYHAEGLSVWKGLAKCTYGEPPENRLTARLVVRVVSMSQHIGKAVRAIVGVVARLAAMGEEDDAAPLPVDVIVDAGIDARVRKQLAQMLAKVAADGAIVLREIFIDRLVAE